MTLFASADENNYDNIRTKRIKEMYSIAEKEFQFLLNEAAKYQKLINDSKTHAKKQFYIKKFRKIQNLVLQTTYTMHYLNQLQKAPLEITNKIKQENINDKETTCL